VVIQLGAILAVVVIFFNKLNPIDRRKTKREVADTMQLWYKVIIACLPAAVIGLLFDDWLDDHLYKASVVAAMLIIYGIFFILVERHNKGKTPKITDLNRLTYKTAFAIGMFQVLSLIPGTSRSGATILGALLLGTSRYVATEFTFFLAIPVMFGASLLKIVKFGFAFSGLEVAVLLTGMIVAFVVSVISIKFLISYIKNNSFTAFGIYRIVLGVLVLAYFFFK
jgi:undecaprenyl-diphosphatase